MTETRAGRATPPQATEIERQQLGAKLKDAREYLELSQDEVAKALDLPRTAISMIENGQRKVEAIELKKFAEIYQRSISHFTGEERGTSPLPKAIEHLARAAAKLTDKDRVELLRFAQFLQARERK